MKKIIILIIILYPAWNIKAITADNSPYSYHKQPALIRAILDKEKNVADLKNLIDIINSLDDVYDNLYGKLLQNKKITVFIDPAHGKLKDGRWQGGEATKRLSCTNKPEEFYSIIISRAMYNQLRENKFIEIKSTTDFFDVLNNKREDYDNIPFSTTVELAKKEGAFIIISEHLNNVSMYHKADGVVNIPGIHITRDYYGKKILRLIPKPYEGFLTLYNRSDTTGFSRQYALTLKNKLISLGMKPNFWQQGAVGDDRFCYFFDFPISVIYETGFISNLEEEKMLRDPERVKKIVNAQYESIIENIKDHFGVDISGDKPRMVKKTPAERIELLKLARVAVYYLKNADTKKSLSVISEMEKKYGKTSYGDFLEYFKLTKDILIQIQKNVDLGEKYKKLSNNYLSKKDLKESNRYKIISLNHFKIAKNFTYKPIFDAYNNKINDEIDEKIIENQAGKTGNKKNDNKSEHSENITRHTKASVLMPIILPMDDNQSLKEALQNALSPDINTLNKLTALLGEAKTTTGVLKTIYSESLKKTVSYRARVSSKIKYKKGIYIVKLNSRLQLVDIHTVESVNLDSKKFQNQQYLNNSFFCDGSKEKSL